MYQVESVILAFIIAGLNDLDICDWDIDNSYLKFSSQEKLWTERSDYGSEKG